MGSGEKPRLWCPGQRLGGLCSGHGTLCLAAQGPLQRLPGPPAALGFLREFSPSQLRLLSIPVILRYFGLILCAPSSEHLALDTFVFQCFVSCSTGFFTFLLKKPQKFLLSKCKTNLLKKLHFFFCRFLCIHFKLSTNQTNNKKDEFFRGNRIISFSSFLPLFFYFHLSDKEVIIFEQVVTALVPFFTPILPV